MDRFDRKLAVIRGGGTGIGRELARQLAAENCRVALCDVSAENMARTKELCERGSSKAPRVTTFVADVSDESQGQAFRDAVARDHDTDHIHVLINNAGIAGGGSFVRDDREEWDKTFAVCWGGVYFCTRPI